MATRAGLSNHERARLEMLRDTIIDVDAVFSADDVGFDEFGDLVWTVQDHDDGIPPAAKKVIYLDGHSDTVQALRGQWHDKLGGAVDPYDGLLDESALDRDAVRAELGYLPPDDEWEHLVFGRGTADQLAGVVSQIIATKILLELASEGALRGALFARMPPWPRRTTTAVGRGSSWVTCSPARHPSSCPTS